MAKEYIERGALLKKAIEEKRFVFRTEDLLNREVVFQTIYKDLFDFVNSIPTADVVEVTYCKDCSHCDPENKHCDHPMGTSLPMPRKDNDFCSYGERKW